MSANLFSALLLGFLAKLAITALVPNIQNNNVMLEPLGDHKYTLRINHMGGVREEIVEEIAPGKFLVKGKLEQEYPPQFGRLIVIYEAGPNGYIAKYTYVTEKEPTIFRPQFLSPGALKSSVG